MTENRSVRNVLRASALFGDLPDAAFELLAGVSARQTASAGEYLFCQGDNARHFCLVVSGRVRLVQHTLDGKDVTMATFVPGDVVGLLAALDGDLYPGTAEALDSVEVLTFPAAIIEQLMLMHAPLAVRVLRIMSGMLHEAYNRIRELSAERVQRRVARSLLRLASRVGVPGEDGAIRLDIRLSRQDLAQMNGTTLETVSRTLSAWEQEGMIRAGREHITIVQSQRLTALAEDTPA